MATHVAYVGEVLEFSRKSHSVVTVALVADECKPELCRRPLIMSCSIYSLSRLKSV